ncbi:enterochelin esterase [Pseudescherichia sp.]|uniref:enterochelin esterase n=1 Tax=Pseudescherichia sp. TaxID=2055881 RepID=UPI00289701B8|nr:enterochelin esterase [Pseudescherichia sp.]
MTTQATGSAAWWESKHGPEWSREGEDRCRVTFWWRDPAGSETTSSVQRVWIYITGVTDHHQRSRPQSLSRIPGTDVWFWQTTLNANWRGSYCLIPSENEHDFAESAFTGEEPDRVALREGWRKLLAHAVADPLNPLSWRGGRGHAVSALEMPDAPEQPGWQAPQDTPFTPPTCIHWRSARLGNKRRVWIYTTGEERAAERPLAVLLDGQFWAQSMPVWPVLAALTQQGKLPPAVYVLVDSTDNAQRSIELPCNSAFWQALQEELLPQIQALAPFSDDPSRTVVAGQSFGGLAALYAGLNWPARFGCVLSQSGSFWWPHRGAQQDGVVIDQIKTGSVQAHSLRIVLEAGAREPLLFRVNQSLYSLLQPTAAAVFWRPTDGGHDALCWRGGLTAGLMTLWQPLIDAGQ